MFVFGQIKMVLGKSGENIRVLISDFILSPKLVLLGILRGKAIFKVKITQLQTRTRYFSEHTAVDKAISWGDRA
jgi:hypothetical protein